MSTTIRCDKCGMLLEGNQHAKVKANYTSLLDGYVEQEWDLCKNCLLNFKLFIEEKSEPKLDGRNE